MPIPLSGSFSMGDIISEIGAGLTTPKGLNSLAAGEYVPLNQTSPYPVSKLPGEMTSMSDWRGYDHGFESTTTTTTTTTTSPCYEHSLGYDIQSSYSACNDTSTSVLFTDNAVFSLSTQIYTQCQDLVATTGFYSDGLNWLKWDSEAGVVLSGSCDCNKVQLSYSEISSTDACSLFDIEKTDYYIDIPSLDITAAGFIGSDCGIAAPSGYYSNGSNWVQWNGTDVIAVGDCASTCFEHAVVNDTETPCVGDELIVYTDSEVFAESTLIHSDDGCSILSEPGYYSDGANWIQWDGESVVETGTCESSGCVAHEVQYNEGEACAGGELVVVYTDSADWSSSTTVFGDEGCSSTVADGFYLFEGYWIAIRRGNFLGGGSC